MALFLSGQGPRGLREEVPRVPEWDSREPGPPIAELAALPRAARTSPSTSTRCQSRLAMGRRVIHTALRTFRYLDISTIA